MLTCTPLWRVPLLQAATQAAGGCAGHNNGKIGINGNTGSTTLQPKLPPGTI